VATADGPELTAPVAEAPTTPPRLAAWRWVAFAAVLAALMAGSTLAGAAGVFTSSERRLGRDLLQPATRLAATADLAQGIATAIGQDNPVIPGAEDEHACPADYAARASALIGAFTPQGAGAALRRATTQLRSTGWRVEAGAVDGTTGGTVAARNRRGVTVDVTQVAGNGLSLVEVTVTVPCALTTSAGPDDGTDRPPTGATGG
jgi:hypothetical protein